MSLDCIDWFCGMGGSSSGLVEAGIEIRVAANHWARAIETHAANHPDTDHLCADIQAIDLRRLPKTRLMWGSPICTEVSPAGGRKRRTQQMDLFEQHGHVQTAAFERTRVTFWEVIRAAELFRHDVIMIENVVEAVTAWELFDVWLAGMRTLGYTPHFVSISAAHAWSATNAPAPQWRDRIYIVLTRKGIKAPDLDPRPLAWCEQCGEVVPAVQWWKPHGIPVGYKVGKYNQQYHYVCPEGHGRIEPYVAPASAAIDWTDLGTRIGDRKRPLAAKTMARIRYGAQLVESGAYGFSMAHGGRARPVDLTGEPMRTWTTGDTEAMTLAPSFLVPELRGSGLRLQRVGGTQPLQTFAASGRHHALVVPFRKGDRAHYAGTEPITTTATRAQHGLMVGQAEMDVDDYHFRMLKPREAANAQRFDRNYVIHGNQGEQQMQAGNAVAVNVAHWIGQKVVEALDGVAA